MAKILLVEDDDDLAFAIADVLEFEHYAVERAGTADEAEYRLGTGEYDVVIMDVTLPGEVTGLDLCSRYRSKGGSAPVIFLTGHDKLQDKERGFLVGGDDYLTKPFHFKELLWRVKALLKRGSVAAASGDRLTWKNMVLDLPSFTLMRDTDEIRLTKQEFALLEVFMRNPGKVLSPDFLLRRVWSDEQDRSLEALRSLMKKLRQKIDTEPKKSVIQNLHGIGYRLGE